MPVDLEVVDVGAEALDQPRILATLDALADQLGKNGCRGRHGYLAAFPPPCFAAC